MKKYNLLWILFVLVFTATAETHAQKIVLSRGPAKTVAVTKVPQRKVVFVNNAVLFRRGIIVKTIPRTRKRFVYKGVTIYFYNGTYYQAHPNGYIRVKPFG